MNQTSIMEVTHTFTNLSKDFFRMSYCVLPTRELHVVFHGHVQVSVRQWQHDAEHPFPFVLGQAPANYGFREIERHDVGSCVERR